MRARVDTNHGPILLSHLPKATSATPSVYLSVTFSLLIHQSIPPPPTSIQLLPCKSKRETGKFNGDSEIQRSEVEEEKEKMGTYFTSLTMLIRSAYERP